jgi:hypothetical protein
VNFEPSTAFLRKDFMSVFLASDKPRFDLVPASPAVRPHQIVLFADAPQQERQHAVKQIKRLMDEGDESAVAVLAQWRDSGLALE